MRTTKALTLASLVLVDPRGKTLLLSPPKSARKSAAADDIHTLVSRMWHFPTVAVRHGQPDSELRKFAEVSSILSRKFRGEFLPLKKLRHAVTYRAITLLPFRVEVQNLPRIPSVKAFPLTGLSSLAISNLTRKVARAALASR